MRKMNFIHSFIHDNISSMKLHALLLNHMHNIYFVISSYIFQFIEYTSYSIYSVENHVPRFCLFHTISVCLIIDFNLYIST